MSKSESIKYAGYSLDKTGKMRFRTATNEKRIYQLESLGEAVSMVSIRPVNSKSEAAKELLVMDYLSKDPVAVAFFVQNAKNDNPFVKPKKARTVTIKRTTVADAVMAEAKVKFANEDKITAKQAAKIRAEFNAKVKAAYEAN